MDPFLLVGLGYTAVTIASILALHAGKVVVPRVGEWKTPPRVLVYRRGAVTIVDVRKAMKVLEDLGHVFGAVEVVETFEKAPGAIVIGPPDPAVALANAIASANWTTAFEEDPSAAEFSEKMGPPPLSTDPKNIIGPVNGGWILDAYIGIDRFMLDQRDVVRVVAHELGHALGYLHEETALFGRKKVEVVEEDGTISKRKGRARGGIVGRKTGHLMNPIYEKGGYNVKGMEVEALDDERQVIARKRLLKR